MIFDWDFCAFISSSIQLKYCEKQNKQSGQWNPSNVLLTIINSLFCFQCWSHWNNKLKKGLFFISTRTCTCESLLTTNVSINVRIVVVYNWYYIFRKCKMQLNYWNFALKSSNIITSTTYMYPISTFLTW